MPPEHHWVGEGLVTGSVGAPTHGMLLKPRPSHLPRRAGSPPSKRIFPVAAPGLLREECSFFLDGAGLFFALRL